MILIEVDLKDPTPLEEEPQGDAQGRVLNDDRVTHLLSAAVASEDLLDAVADTDAFTGDRSRVLHDTNGAHERALTLTTDLDLYAAFIIKVDLSGAASLSVLEGLTRAHRGAKGA